MIVISDTTAISNLVQIGELKLLQEIYQKIIIPEGVYQELLVLQDFNIPIVEKLMESWIEVKKVRDQELLHSIQKEIDQGEAEAISLAIELKADILLIDEKEGRRIAKNRKIPIVGTIGILLQAKKSGLIDSSVEEKMRALQEIGFWINEKLFAQIVEIEKQL